MKTTIDFGSEAATHVVCSTTKSCTAVTPYELEGTVPVTATVGAATSTDPITFTYTKFAPPTVEIVASAKGAKFSKSKLKDRYPAIFTYGNIYLQITNSTTETQTFTGPTGPVTLEAGSSEGYNIPVNESSPYVFVLTTTSPKNTLTVATKQPR